MALSFFGRGLGPKDVKVGDRVIYQTPRGTYVEGEVKEVATCFVRTAHPWGWIPYRLIREVLRKEE